MSALNNSLLLGQEGGGGYAISRSLRFNSSDSAYLSRTPASAGNRKTWTWAGWVKRSKLSASMRLLRAVSGGTEAGIQLLSGNTIELYDFSGAGYTWQLVTSQLFRDVSAWYHLLIAFDTTQGTAANRVSLYVNGTKVSAFSTSSYPSQNFDGLINTTNAHAIAGSDLLFDGYLADIHFIDGQALDPTSFGEFDANGIWQPISYSGTYGTNGFHLDFADNSTAAALGTDSSGNGNTWTVNNLSVTAGAGNDSLVDVPTNGSEVDTGVGGEVRGNYATLNPLDRATVTALANGNLDYSTTGAGGVRSTIGMSSGKYYAEVTVGNASLTVGIAASGTALNNYLGANAGEYGYGQNGYKLSSTGQVPYGSTFTTGDVIGIAFDADAGNLYFYKNGTIQASGTAAFSGLTNNAYFFAVSNNVTTNTCNVNFGQRPFTYPVSGFKALNTSSLPAPVVTKPSTVMDVKLYTGNGTSQTISGLGFSPDLVWTKSRSAFDRHNVFDILRSGLRLRTDGTEAEDSTTVALTSNGFSLGSQSENNSNGQSYVAWTWDAGSSTVTNTQGSISSQVRANASAGFSIVTYTGTGANATVGHGLGVAPQMIIVKSRGSVTNWGVGHTSIGWANALRLNTTDASSAQATFWNSTAPTSTVFSIGTGPSTNNNGDSIVAYCFAPVAGYSAFGSYTGNGSTDGPFVYTGFRPRWVLIKTSTLAGWGWVMYDTARNTSNIVNAELYAHSNNQEVTADRLDILSNGFKLRATSSYLNGSSETYVWAAFAESPFQYARAR